MEIIIAFNRSLEQSYEIKSEKDWCFKIYFMHEGKTYPDDAWYDVGALLVDGWIYEFNKARREGGMGTLYFREGPYWLDFHFQDAIICFFERDGDGSEYARDTVTHFADLLNDAVRLITEYHNTHFDFRMRFTYGVAEP